MADSFFKTTFFKTTTLQGHRSTFYRENNIRVCSRLSSTPYYVHTWTKEKFRPLVGRVKQRLPLSFGYHCPYHWGQGQLSWSKIDLWLDSSRPFIKLEKNSIIVWILGYLISFNFLLFESLWFTILLIIIFHIHNSNTTPITSVLPQEAQWSFISTPSLQAQFCGSVLSVCCLWAFDATLLCITKFNIYNKHYLIFLSFLTFSSTWYPLLPSLLPQLELFCSF